MRNLGFVVLLMMGLIGCSKDGASSHLMNGPEATATAPTPTDHNLPGPDGNPAP